MTLNISDSAKLPVIVLFNQPYGGTRPEDRAAELGVLDAVGSAVSALGKAGFSVETLGLIDDLSPLVARLRNGPATVLNFCEAFCGRMKGEAYVAGLLELLGCPYTGSTPDAILLCMNKIHTKRLLAGAGLPTLPFFEFHCNELALDAAELAQKLAVHGVQLPAIVKPVANDASEGIYQSSVVRTAADVHATAERLGRDYGFPLLVEQFIAGREFNIAVIDNPEPHVLPISEIVFKGTRPDWWPIVSYEAKWVAKSDDDLATEAKCPAEVHEPLASDLGRLARDAIRLTGCRDYARVDIRIDPAGRPFILEVNANPDLSPAGGLHCQLAAAGISHELFIARLVEQAIARGTRMGQPSMGSCAAESKASKGKPTGISESSLELRPLLPSDREGVREVLVRCGNFRADEIEVGMELVDEALNKRGVEDYQFVIATVGGRVVGYSCFGPVPLAENVWDLYWIAADPTVQGLGVGSRLQAATERQIQGAGGRLILAETSSLPSYAAARAFYARQGFQLLERLADFYRPGDDRLTFGKRLE